METLILSLYEVGAVKFGQFTLKSGIQSPFYLDLRIIVSFPHLLKQVANCIWAKIQGLSYDVICGVPYTALPIATAISLEHNIPMVMRRKETKTYGTKQQVEGVFSPNQTCLIIEDVITSGMSIMETGNALNSVSLQVRDAVVLVDRDCGGRENLFSRSNIRLHSVINVEDIIRILNLYDKFDMSGFTQIKPKELSYEERAGVCKNGGSYSQTLLTIMAEKQTNLCVAADLTTCEAVLNLASSVGPYICVLKTHVDIITDFSEDFIHKLCALAKKYRFLLFEDRKYADIGNTVELQYTGGLYRTVEWADIVNTHILPGPGIIESLSRNGKGKGLLLVAEMSSRDNLCYPAYTQKAVEWATKYNAMGFISMRRLCDDVTMIHMTPGVKMENCGDEYKTPHKVIFEQKSDVIIVGRDIYTNENPVERAKLYQKAGWEAYKQRIT